jgi:HAD superfamily hydrolase (TIGR01484 family)
MSGAVPFLFAADLDGTLLPNTGKRPEPGCLERTRELLLALHGQGCPVCYVTGRHLSLARRGAGVFRLPLPTWWICNVGTEIHDRNGAADTEWSERLGAELDHRALRRALAGIPRLALQETAKQGPYKLSFYYPEPVSGYLWADIMERAAAVREGLQLVASVEESSGRALLDLIPAAAGKAHAVRHVADRYGFSGERLFFAGDSGNDLDVLLSGGCGALMGNAPREVLVQARRLEAARKGARLYAAEAYYGDGVIEGLHHYGLWPPAPAGTASE